MEFIFDVNQTAKSNVSTALHVDHSEPSGKPLVCHRSEIPAACSSSVAGFTSPALLPDHGQTPRKDSPQTSSDKCEISTQTSENKSAFNSSTSE
eukprot:9468602-Pyramimonas_sp.AAC.1